MPGGKQFAHFFPPPLTALRGGRDHSRSRAFRQAVLGAVGADRLQHGRAVLRRLPLADAVDGVQRGWRVRQVGRQLGQRAIREDHEGRHIGGVGKLAAELAQLLEEARFVRRLDGRDGWLPRLGRHVDRRPLQRRAAPLGDAQAAELHVLGEQALADELLGVMPPLRSRVLCAGAVGGQPVVAAAQHVLAAGAAQDGDDVPCAEHLAGAQDARKKLLRDERGIHFLAFSPGCQAVVAETARRLGGRLAEVFQEWLAAARLGLGIAHHRLQARVAAPPLSRRALLDEAEDRLHVCAAEEQQTVGAQAVAPRPADLLVVALQVGRQVVVQDEAHVRLVDPHPERDRGDDDGDLVAGEKLLVARARRLVHPRVIGQHGPALRRQLCGQPIHAVPRAAVDDARLIAVGGQEGQCLRQTVCPRLHRQEEVLSVEAGNEDVRRTEAEDGADVVADMRRGGRGERHAHRLAVAPAHREELAVFGPEVVAPG